MAIRKNWKRKEENAKIIITSLRQTGRRKISKNTEQFLFSYKMMQLEIIEHAMSYVT